MKLRTGVLLSLFSSLLMAVAMACGGKAETTDDGSSDGSGGTGGGGSGAQGGGGQTSMMDLPLCEFLDKLDKEAAAASEDCADCWAEMQPEPCDPHIPYFQDGLSCDELTPAEGQQVKQVYNCFFCDACATECAGAMMMCD